MNVRRANTAKKATTTRWSTRTIAADVCLVSLLLPALLVESFTPSSCPIHSMIRSHPCSFTTTTTKSETFVPGIRISASSSSLFRLKQSLFDNDHDDLEDDEDDDEDDEYIDTASLGDWRAFRRDLTFEEREEEGDSFSSASVQATKKKKPKSAFKDNEEILREQNERLAQEFISGAWAHEIATPEVGGLVLRMPLEVELYKNYKHSIIGRRLRQLLDEGNGKESSIEKWRARAILLIEDEMKKIALTADEEGQIDATRLNDESSEMLSLFLDHQEHWQEVCLVVEHEQSKSKTVVLNRPMAFKLTDNIGRLVLNGAFQTPDHSSSSSNIGEHRKDLTRFMMAFSSECAVYVGGPDEQNSRALMIHGIPDLPGAVEISPGSNLYQGGIDAAVKGVLEGEYSPLEFRFFVGCHLYDESALDVAVHLGKYLPVACARSVVLKQCISLPKPLWHEVMELCGGDLLTLSILEKSKRDEMQFHVVDETDYDEIEELDNYDDEDDDYL